jgi:dTDP-4-dehydrorhamnose reductase
MRIVVLGKNGQLGDELQREMRRCGMVIAVGRESADLEEPKQLRSFLRNLAPDVIINSAAYTNVDRAETEPKRARRVNAIAPGIIAEEALRARAILFHFSTDYVFDGEKQQPYLECDQPSPLNTYGATKLKGEKAIADVGGAYFIFRTSWVFGRRGNNFVSRILHLAQERKELTVVHDQVGVPTSAVALAAATRLVLLRLQFDAERRGIQLYTAARHVSGIYNAVCDGQGTWHEFAEAIVESARRTPLRAGLRVQNLVPIGSDVFPSKAKRPAYSVLARNKLQKAFEITMPHWRSCLQTSVQALAEV